MLDGKLHWIKSRNLMLVVMSIWAVFSLFIHWFAPELNKLSFIGFPLGYYMAVQGSLIVFVTLIFVSNWVQDKIDDKYDA